MSTPKVNITLGPGMSGSVLVVHEDGTEVDISGAVNAVVARREPDGSMTTTLSLPWASASFLDVAAHVPADTRQALIELGWTPPDSPENPDVFDVPHEEVR